MTSHHIFFVTIFPSKCKFFDRYLIADSYSYFLFNCYQSFRFNNWLLDCTMSSLQYQWWTCRNCNIKRKMCTISVIWPWHSATACHSIINECHVSMFWQHVVPVHLKIKFVVPQLKGEYQGKAKFECCTNYHASAVLAHDQPLKFESFKNFKT